MCAIGLCDDVLVPAMPLNMSLTSSPACRVNTERPPGCVNAEKSTTSPSHDEQIGAVRSEARHLFRGVRSPMRDAISDAHVRVPLSH